MTRCLVLTGGRASAGPYGVDRLGDLGYEIVEVQPAARRLHRKVRDVIEHRAGRPMDKTFRSISLATSADLVLAFLEREGLAPSWAKAHGIPPYSRKPLVMIACWLADELRTMDADQRRAVVRQYRGVDLTLVFSSNQIDVLVDAGFRSDAVENVHFGFAPEQFPLADPTQRRGIVAIGSDRGRDYPTLLKAVRGSDHRVDLFCREGNLQGSEVPVEVEFHGTVSFDRYRQEVAKAGVVAVPTRELAYPTGQTVALEAAATGACLVLTSTPAMREYFTNEGQVPGRGVRG